MGNMSAVYPVEKPWESRARHNAEAWEAASKNAAINFDKVNPNMHAAAAATGQVAANTATAAASATGLIGSLKSMSQPITNAIGLVARFSGYISIIIGGVTTIYQIVDFYNQKQKEINDKIKTQNELVKSLREELSKLDSTDALEKRLDLLGQIQQAEEEALFLRSGKQKDVDDARARYATERGRLKNAEQEKQDNESTQRRAKRYLEIQSEIARMEGDIKLESLDGIEKLEEQKRQARERAERRISEETDADRREDLIRLAELESKLFDGRIERERKAIAERDAKLQEESMRRQQQQQEEIERAARAFSEAFSKEAQSASESIRDAFRDANTTNYLRDAAASLRAILQQRRL